jgi:putative SOS response-associated peptidase YedK
MINARSETVAEKPAFRAAFKRRRCLVPADGFFEWKVTGNGEGGRKTKVPHWIHLSGRQVFAFAGLWESWEPKDADPIHSFTILTTQASESIRGIHPRMPVILTEAEYDLWLSSGSGEEEVQALLRPLPSERLSAHPVSTLVNSPGNDRPECIEPLQP